MVCGCSITGTKCSGSRSNAVTVSAPMSWTQPCSRSGPSAGRPARRDARPGVKSAPARRARRPGAAPPAPGGGKSRCDPSRSWKVTRGCGSSHGERPHAMAAAASRRARIGRVFESRHASNDPPEREPSPRRSRNDPRGVRKRRSLQARRRMHGRERKRSPELQTRNMVLDAVSAPAVIEGSFESHSSAGRPGLEIDSVTWGRGHALCEIDYASGLGRTKITLHDAYMILPTG
jgi:hypothetical protein